MNARAAFRQAEPARTRRKPVIGPQHHGRRMSLRMFEFAQVDHRYLIELARGYLVVSEVANLPHGLQIGAINQRLFQYAGSAATAIFAILGSMDCKLLIPQLESERHPDISVYLTKPKGRRDRTLWRTWFPDLVIEVVSESSRDRDYTEKRDEYWTLGIKEYWIVDAKLQRVVILKRGRTKWTETVLGPADNCETKLLPGFQLSCREVFAAAEENV